MKDRGDTSLRVTKNFENGNHDTGSEMKRKKGFFCTIHGTKESLFLSL